MRLRRLKTSRCRYMPEFGQWAVWVAWGNWEACGYNKSHLLAHLEATWCIVRAQIGGKTKRLTLRLAELKRQRECEHEFVMRGPKSGAIEVCEQCGMHKEA